MADDEMTRLAKAVKEWAEEWTEEDEDDEDDLLAEADLADRIARYLQVNGFRNLEDAARKGWGDTRPLTQQQVIQ